MHDFTIRRLETSQKTQPSPKKLRLNGNGSSTVLELEPDPVEQFTEHMEKVGLACAEPVIDDGEIHRFAEPRDKRGETSGWYWLNGFDDSPHGAVGTWRGGRQSYPWTSRKSGRLDSAQWKAYRQAVIQSEEFRQQKQAIKAAEAQKRLQYILDHASTVTDHPYLEQKQVPLYPGVVQYRQALVVPLHNGNGEILSLQFITLDHVTGQFTKRFLSGLPTQGLFHMLGELQDGETVFLCEGYSTAATVFQVTQKPTVVSFFADNLLPVAVAVRQQYPKAKLIFAADNDSQTPGNPGITKARAAAKAVNAKVVYPTFKDTSGKPTDFNDLYAMTGQEETRRQLAVNAEEPGQDRPMFESISAAELYAKEFPPVKWIVPRLLPEGLTLLCGKAKLGKSWLALSIAIAVSKGGAALHFAPVEQGTVLFLSLEDSERQLQQRQKILTQDAAHQLKDLHFVNEAPRIGNGFRTMLCNWLEQNPKTRLVVIDTLSKIVPLKQNDKNLFLSDHDLISSLKSIADRYRACLLVVHHLRKAESADALDAVAGTGGLVAGASTTMVLRRERGQMDAALFCVGKEIMDADLAMQFDQESCAWKILGDAREFQLNSDRKEIIDTLREYGPMSGRELARMLGKNTRAITGMLTRMERDNLIFKDGATRNSKWEVR